MPSGSVILPVSFWTTATELVRYGHEPRQVMDKFYVGLPFQMRDPQNIKSREYVMVRLTSFLSPHVNREAARLEGLMVRAVYGGEDHKAGWDELMRRPEIVQISRNPGAREAWGLMILRMILRDRPPSYFEGSQHLADYFADRFELKFEPSFLRHVFHKQLLERAYIEADPDLKMELGLRYDDRLKQLEALANGSESFMRAMVLAMGLLSGVTELIALDIVLEALIGYIAFAADVKQLKEDGLVSEEEAFGLWLSRIGIFLPFVRVAPGCIQILTNTITTVGAVIAILGAVLMAVVSFILGLLEFVAADEVGFETFGQYDSETTVFIEV